MQISKYYSTNKSLWLLWYH